MQVKHYLQFKDFSLEEYEYLFARTKQLKALRNEGKLYQPFLGKSLAMFFDKNSTRTRVSFEAGMHQFGGGALFLTSKDTQIGRGEPIADVAKVVSRMVDIVMIRTFEQTIVEEFAKNSKVPVINGLTDEYHPCQVLADIFTYIEHRGDIRGKTVTWIGDSNNVCNTWLQASQILGFNLHVCTPPGFELEAERSSDFKEEFLEIFEDPLESARGADLVTTDVWVSMGYEDESVERKESFVDYCVDDEIMSLANPDALFMHCLPAHRGEEVEASVIDGPQSVVWDEAENRLHTQKAVMEYLLLGKVL